jgi:hypothetical protein
MIATLPENGLSKVLSVDALSTTMIASAIGFAIEVPPALAHVSVVECMYVGENTHGC